MTRPNTINDFWLKVRKTRSCWYWQGSMRGGYGRFKFKDKTHNAHHLSYELLVGKIPKGKIIMHSCDRPNCVNPKHLIPATQKQNCEDRDNKGRHVALLGEMNGNTIMTCAKVRLIKRRYIPYKVSQQSLAEEFNCSREAISAIVTGRTWSHI